MTERVFVTTPYEQLDSVLYKKSEFTMSPTKQNVLAVNLKVLIKGTEKYSSLHNGIRKSYGCSHNLSDIYLYI